MSNNKETNTQKQILAPLHSRILLHIIKMKEMLGSGNTVYLTRSCPRSVHISALLFSTNLVSSETSDILRHWATYIFPNLNLNIYSNPEQM